MMDRSKSTSNKPVFILQTYQDRIASKELSQKLSERLSNLNIHQEQPAAASPSPATASSAAIPPPPPPPSATNGSATNTLKKSKGKAPPVPVKTSTLSFHQPPPCPTPDYDTLSIVSNSSSLPKQNGFHKSASHNNNNNNNNKLNNGLINDSVEMESLESFKLSQPNGIKPKPPDTYFKVPLSGQLSNNSTTSSSTLRKQRPVSVTIGEYPSGTLRRQPGRLDFLSSGGENGASNSQFASELAQTLSRSNLRKRTESMENLLNCPQIKPQTNGSVRISFNNKNFAKSTNDLTNLESFSKALANRVTINVHSMMEKKMDTLPNGILKNGASHKPLVQQKSITFGEMPTVINDRPLHVT